MATRFYEIYDPKRRNEIIEENLRLKKKLKNRAEEQENLKNEVEQKRVELFKPIIESNQKIQNEMVEERKEIIDTLSNFNRLQILDTGSSPSQPIERHAIEYRENVITVSKLIAQYLQNALHDPNTSYAGYSIRRDKENHRYTMGNKVVEFDNNDIKIGNQNYNATTGLLELLLKKKPNFVLITDEDKQNYFRILDDSNGVYQGFDPSTSNRLNSGPSEKWKFIRTEYLKEK